ncbi:hypothetical protein MTZ49_10880 [Entomomonas sp. E2T0]|uniref:hypothetical protein n=1 Tax=Entomomonas sp. E2T0 TaxID=2930213 RepID=UPI0022284D0C|nr:hypothetical protein [Entomomonas sp. E2T0]UYZ83105.1 hypothetical protein MTZ49_10880 [Entomomonas sp. E2T0]
MTKETFDRIKAELDAMNAELDEIEDKIIRGQIAYERLAAKLKEPIITSILEFTEQLSQSKNHHYFCKQCLQKYRYKLNAVIN